MQKWKQLYQILTNSVSFIMALINTVDYETRRCYQQNRQKNPLPSSYFSSSIIQFTSRDQNNLIIMYRLPNVHEQDSPLAAFLKIHSCKLAKFLVSILDPLTRNQLSVKQIMFTSSHCYSLSNSNKLSTLISF